MRIIITGGPRTGKTTMSNDIWCYDYTMLHTDDFIDLSWTEQSEKVSHWFWEHGGDLNWIAEGVTCVRALRKFFENDFTFPPCDLLIYLTVAHEELLPGQLRLKKATDTIFDDDVFDNLASSGVVILTI